MNIRDVLQKIENNAFWGSLKNCTLLPGRLAKEIAVLENAMLKGIHQIHYKYINSLKIYSISFYLP